MCVCSGQSIPCNIAQNTVFVSSGADFIVGCDKIQITKLSNYVESYVSLNK